MLCSKCKSPVASEAGFCGVCGNKMGSPTTQEQKAEVPVNLEVSVSSEGGSLSHLVKRYKTVLGGILMMVVLALAVLFVGIPLFSQGNASPVIYLGKNQLLMQESNQKDPIELSRQIVEWDEWQDTRLQPLESRMLMRHLVQLNENQDKLFFVKRVKDEGTATIYYRDLKKKASSWDDDQGIKLASGASMVNDKLFTINSSGTTVLYIKGYEGYGGGKLYLHNLSDEVVIDTRVTNYWYSDVNSVIYYTKANDEEREDLYVVHTNKLDDKKKVDSNVSYVVQFDEVNGDIHYSKYDADKELNSLTLYSKTLKQDKVKLLSDIDSLVSNIEDNTFYYKVAVNKEVVLSSLVEDDMSAHDMTIVEPAITDYQSIVNTPYTDYWTGDTYYEDVVNTDYDAYDRALNQYYEKNSRDQLRQSLSEEKYIDVSYSLYLFSEGKGNKITDDYNYDSFNDISNKTMLYYKIDHKSMNKILLSEIEYVGDVRSAYDENVTYSEITYMANNLVADIEFLGGRYDNLFGYHVYGRQVAVRHREYRLNE